MSISYIPAHASEMLAKSQFGFEGFEILETPESSVQDFVVKNQNNYYGVQVKSSKFNDDKKYVFECRKRNFSKRKDGSNILGDWKPYLKKDIEFFVLVARDIKKCILIVNKEERLYLNYRKEEFIKFADISWKVLDRYIDNNFIDTNKTNHNVVDLFNMEK